MAVPKIWVLRGIRKGIVTSRFPRARPTVDEVPERSLPPDPSAASVDWTAGEELCPTGAIQAPEKRVELGKCVYCRRCADAGFSFGGGDKGEMGSALQAHTVGAASIEDWKKKQRAFARSFHVLMIDVGSCNACNLEVSNLSNPYYDLTRLGIFFTNSPKHADALIVVGALNKSMVDVLERTYESMPEPKFVISAGACAISGGVFQGTEGFVSPVQNVVPVDVVIPGCPPSPLQILEGLLLAVGKLQKDSMMTGKEAAPQ
jgi:formate hydrogenlyase subunit 7